MGNLLRCEPCMAWSRTKVRFRATLRFDASYLAHSDTPLGLDMNFILAFYFRLFCLAKPSMKPRSTSLLGYFKVYSCVWSS